MEAHKASEKCFRQCTAQLRHLQHQIHAAWNQYHTLSSDSSFSSDFSSGSSSRHSNTSSSSFSDNMSLFDDLDNDSEDLNMPGLEDLTDDEIDGMDTNSDQEEERDVDDEMLKDEDDKDDELPQRSNSWCKLWLWVQEEVTNMYAQHYEAPRNKLPHATGQSQLHHVLTNLKHERPDEFHANLQITPATFDMLVEQLSNDPVFANNSSNPQLSIEFQLTIMLYYLGHDGNALGL